MKITAIVPMKLNSERVKNKNIKSFDNGKPLCTYILESLKKVKNIDDIYVYCSDEAIKEYLPNGIKFLKRNKNLDESDVKINDVLTSFAKDVDSDYYLLTHATAPFLKPETIEKGVDIIKKGEYDSVFTVQKIQNFLWKDNKPMNYKLDDIPRTQDIDPIYCETSGLYIFDKETILKHNRRIGEKPYMLEVSQIESTDIDEEEDFLIANAIYNYNRDF